ncbi:GxxExxY protein [Hwanghaeella sp. LZ110]|jgi:GxxExxY protein|uniref:GxxExxY protein n=1 Tax=Hwanghaeella sp. LZ110 TaxID=3402810 RepID=UPI003B682857
MRENEIGELILGAAIDVHRELGPGLLESTYETCLEMEISGKGLSVARQVVMPIRYKGVDITPGYRLDLLIEQAVVVEVKSLEQVRDVHRAQLLSYLRLGGFRLGYLINFNEVLLKRGVARLVNGL